MTDAAVPGARRPAEGSDPVDDGGGPGPDGARPPGPPGPGPRGGEGGGLMSLFWPLLLFLLLQSRLSPKPPPPSADHTDPLNPGPTARLYHPSGGPLSLQGVTHTAFIVGPGVNLDPPAPLHEGGGSWG